MKALTLTATSGPGFSLKQENLGYAIATEIPCVVVNVQRGGPSTGLPTSPAQGDVMQARWGTHGDHPIIALTPSSVQECYELAVVAFNFAEEFRIPVILLMDEVIGHLREKVILPQTLTIVDREKPAVPPGDYIPYENNESMIPAMANFGDGYRYHVTGLTHTEKGLPTGNPDVIRKFMQRLTYHNQLLTKLVIDAYNNPGFSLVEAIFQCSVSYGRRNKFKTPADMLLWQKEHAFKEGKRAVGEEDFQIGEIFKSQASEYTQEYEKLRQRLRN